MYQCKVLAVVANVWLSYNNRRLIIIVYSELKTEQL